MPDTPAVPHSKKIKSLKKKKSHLPTKDNVIAPPKKKTKSSYIKKSHYASDTVDTNINAVTLAVELGFEKPHDKITIKSSGNDKDEEMTKQVSPVEIIQQLIDYKKACKCNCLADLSMRDVASHRMEITLLDRHSRDLFIMGLLRCGAVTFKDGDHDNSHTRNRYSYRIMNTRICQCCFLTVNNIGGKYLKNLKKHFAEKGVTSRLHGNHGRKPHHAISSSDITDVVDFVNRYASVHGVPAARRPKNPKAEHTVRLPPSDNVTSVHKKYKEFYEHSGKRAVALTSFRKIWSLHLPHIKLTFKDYTPAVKNLASNINMQEVGGNVSSPQHSSLIQVSLTKENIQGTDTTTQLLELQTEVSQKTAISLPYEYSVAELSHNQIIPLGIYMADSSSHDVLHYDYLFSQTSMPSTHHIQTVAINDTAETHDPTSITKTDLTQNRTSPSNNQYPAMSSPVRHLDVPAETSSSAANNHLLLFSPSIDHDASTGHLHPAHFDPKNPTAVFSHTNLIANATADIDQEPSGLVGESLTNLSQHIQMSLFH